MEQSFWEKLKRVKPGDLIHFFVFLLAVPISFFYRKKRPDLWVLCDTKQEARDNAYWLFRYIRKEHPEQDAVFAIDKKSPDFIRVKEIGEAVRYGSLKHWVCYLSASRNVSSQKMGKPNAAVCYVLEVYGILKNKRAFLQHGIITADLSFLYYEHTRMSLFVTSTQDEWEYVKQNYGYPEGVVKKLGLCRFDELHDFQIRKNQLLIMPTWRMYIRNEIKGDTKEAVIQKFRETDYFKYWNGLLENEGFQDFIQNQGIQVLFYPHREMFHFLEYFHVDHPNITIASWPDYDVQQLLKESAFLITDFSSVAMDFAYMKKPLLYYQFDNDKFRSSHHGTGYFDFKSDGFGPVCVTPEEVVKELNGFWNRGFVNRPCYLRRHADYFDLYDTDNCRRNYEAVKGM